MEAIFNKCWVFRGEKCGIYKPKLGIYTPRVMGRVMGTGTLVHSLGSMNLSPMIQISRRSSHSAATFFLWVISRMVVDGRAAKRRLNNSRSVSSSRAELISSSKKTAPGRRSPRAMAMRCACPSLNPPPCSDNTVSIPCGKSKTKSAHDV